MRAVSVLLVAVVLLAASSVYAAKLAPSQNTLQPLPPDVQPAVSQSVQRSASQTDLQIIQTAQATEQPTNTEQPGSTGSSVSPVPYLPNSSGSDSIALLVALVCAVFVAGTMVWFWRSF